MKVEVGDSVTFVDENRQEHQALVTFVHGPQEFDAEWSTSVIRWRMGCSGR